MFENFTENARRAIFFARYEASHVGVNEEVGDLHILLGVLRERGKRLMVEITGREELKEVIEKDARERLPTRLTLLKSYDLPCSAATTAILGLAVMDAEANVSHVATINILAGIIFAGIIRQEGCEAAQILRANGITLERVRAVAKTWRDAC